MKQVLFSMFLAGAAGLAACGAPQPVEPVRVFPDAPEATTFTRAYSMTEAPDGVRVYVQEDGDTTAMFVVKRDGNGWAEPVEIDLPTRGYITGPHFSRFDNMFYYASNAAFPERDGYKDLNIWRAEYLGDGQFGEPEPLPMPDINTGANEIGVATTQDGLVLLVTNHSRGGLGSYDIMQGREGEDGSWSFETMPEGVNDRLIDDHVAVDPQGRWMIFYSHRSPKMGASDLWISERGEDGIWQTPENLGPFVNTAEIEFGAGLSWDGQTLFFSRGGNLMEVPLSAVLEADRTLP